MRHYSACMADAQSSTRTAQMRITLRDPSFMIRVADVRDLGAQLQGLHDIAFLLDVLEHTSESVIDDPRSFAITRSRPFVYKSPTYLRVHRMTYNSDPMVWVSLGAGVALSAAVFAGKTMDIVLKAQQAQLNDLAILEKRSALGFEDGNFFLRAFGRKRRTERRGRTSRSTRTREAEEDQLDATVESADRTLRLIKSIDLEDD